MKNAVDHTVQKPAVAHFQPSEFLNNGIPKNVKTIDKLSWWIDYLSLIRELCGFPIKVTDGVRLGVGTSQHYFGGDGAVDIRPAELDPEKFIRLGLVLAGCEELYRVCYYPKSKLFPNGGFHVDRKFVGKHLFVNQGDKVKWIAVDGLNFVRVLMEENQSGN